MPSEGRTNSPKRSLSCTASVQLIAHPIKNDLMVPIGVGHENVSFFCPIFLRHQKRGLLLPKRAAALSEGTQWCWGRNRESRRREAAGRRNWPDAVPRKMSGRKR